MLGKLDFLFRFWELKARHASLGEPLEANEQVELLSLMQLVMTDTKPPRKGQLSARTQSIPAQLIGEGGARAVEVRGLMASAILVTSATPAARGAAVVLRVTDAVMGVEYNIPCRVMWTHEGSPCSTALIVDGIPTRMSFASEAPLPRAAFAAAGMRLVG